MGGGVIVIVHMKNVVNAVAAVKLADSLYQECNEAERKEVARILGYDPGAESKEDGAE
jgi:hypothetical protein